jgi:hypothetical protein
MDDVKKRNDKDQGKKFGMIGDFISNTFKTS